MRPALQGYLGPCLHRRISRDYGVVQPSGLPRVGKPFSDSAGFSYFSWLSCMASYRLAYEDQRMVPLTRSTV